MYVGCAGASGSGRQGIGGAGGGASAVLNQLTRAADSVYLVAGGSGGQAGAWDAGRQVAGVLSSTHGGHGGGATGDEGGTTPCNGAALGGGGATSADDHTESDGQHGAGGTSNRGYDVGEPGGDHVYRAARWFDGTVGGDGGDGGGENGDQTCMTAGGFGFGSGGCGRAVFGDGGGGGGGGGWFGGGGGGGACHGTGGGGGSGYKDSVVTGSLLSGRGVPEGQDGWVVITAEDCANLSTDPPVVQHATVPEPVPAPPPSPPSRPGCEGWVDDPDGVLAGRGSTCDQIVAFGCSIDLSRISPTMPAGVRVSSFCPVSCDQACGSALCHLCRDQQGAIAHRFGACFWVSFRCCFVTAGR